jgi:Rrf2 family protein
MALFSRKVDYALMLLSHLHHQPQGACARALAERFTLKPAFTAKILKRLCSAGLLHSQRGMRGGYTLACDVETLSLGEFLDRLEEPFRLTDCCQGSATPCDLIDTCPVSGTLQTIDRRVRNLLRTIPLSEVFRTPDQLSSATVHGLQLMLMSKE